jgi:proline iminopeptidase/L-proline amide hydrolase
LEDARALRRLLPRDVQQTLEGCERVPTPPAEQCAAAEEAFNSRFLRREPRPREVQAYREALPIPFNERLYRAMWGPNEFVSTGTLRDYDGEHLLARLDGPRTFFVTGQYDEARPETVASFARRVPGAEYAVVPGAAHAIFIDRPQAMLALLSLWLRRNDRP